MDEKILKCSLFQIIALTFSVFTIFLLIMTPTFSKVLSEQQNTASTKDQIKNLNRSLVYANTEFGIEMHYPGNWTKVQDNIKNNETCSGGLCLKFKFLTVNFISPPPSLGVFGITVMASSKPMSYDDWLSYTLPKIKKAIEISGEKVIESKESNVAGVRAYKLTFTKNALTHTDWTFVANEKIYTMSYTISQHKTSALPAFQNVINSIKILNTTNNQTPSVLG